MKIKKIVKLQHKNSRLTDIYLKYKDNDYYRDNPQLFSMLVMIKENRPDNYADLIQHNCHYNELKKWILGLFLLDKISIKLEFSDLISLILSNVKTLPTCRLKLITRELISQI